MGFEPTRRLSSALRFSRHRRFRSARRSGGSASQFARQPMQRLLSLTRARTSSCPDLRSAHARSARAPLTPMKQARRVARSASRRCIDGSNRSTTGQLAAIAARAGALCRESLRAQREQIPRAEVLPSGARGGPNSLEPGPGENREGERAEGGALAGDQPTARADARRASDRDGGANGLWRWTRAGAGETGR